MINSAFAGCFTRTKNKSTPQLIDNFKKTKKMNNNLLFDFTVDKASKMVYIKREFDAELSLVWDAFTKAELIDQWIPQSP